MHGAWVDCKFYAKCHTERFLIGLNRKHWHIQFQRRIQIVFQLKHPTDIQTHNTQHTNTFIHKIQIVFNNLLIVVCINQLILEIVHNQYMYYVSGILFILLTTIHHSPFTHSNGIELMIDVVFNYNNWILNSCCFYSRVIKWYRDPTKNKCFVLFRFNYRLLSLLRLLCIPVIHMQIYTKHQKKKKRRRFLCPCQCMQTSFEWILFLIRFSGLESEEVSEDDFHSIALKVGGCSDGENKKSYYCCSFWKCYMRHAFLPKKETINIVTISRSDGMKRKIIAHRGSL